MCKKKKLMWSITLIFLLLFISSAFALNYDDFEDNNYNSPAGRTPTWRIASGVSSGITSQGVTKYAGSYALRVNNVTAETTIRSTPSDNNYYGYVYNNGAISLFGILRDTNAATFSQLVKVQGAGAAISVACDGAEHSFGYMQNNHWYKIIINYVASAGTSKVWVEDANGQAVGYYPETLACGFVPATMKLQEASGANAFFDNIFYIGGDVAPVYGIDANFSYVKDVPNSRIAFTDTSTDTNVTINAWTWKVNSVNQATTQNFTYTTSENLDLNVCLDINGLGDDANTYSDRECKNVTTWDTQYPTIDGNLVYNIGFATSFSITYNLTCKDNFTPITYQVIKNDTNYIYNASDANNTLVTGSFGLVAPGYADIVMNCIDDGNNVTSLSLDRVYALMFRLVNENTGAVFDLNKVTAAQAFTYDGNFIYNFKDANVITRNFFSPTSTVRFDFTYPDESATKISREINFDYVDDENVGVCVAEYQQFYLYRFLSTSVKPIVVYNDFAKCYNLASTTKFLYNTYQSNTAYTINKPYYLYTYDDGVKMLLALLDGANNTEINLDILAFNQQSYIYSIDTDQITFVPSETDLNTIVFYFTSPNNNESVTLQIYNGDALIWNYTELTDTNLFQVNFYYGDSNIADTNLLKIVVTVVNDGETSSFYKWFNTRAEAYAGILNPIVAIVMSFFVLFFGITMVSYRFAMGWFGLFISFIAIGILAMAPMYDYIVFLMAIYFIIGIFIGVIGREQTLRVSN